MHRTSLLIGFMLISLAPLSRAQDNQLDELTKQIKLLTNAVEQLQSTVNDQQQRIDSLEHENAELTTSQPDPDSGNAPPQPARPSSSPTTLLNSQNPEIGVVVDMVGLFTESKEDEEGNDKRSVRELEITFGGDIDPYTRFDSTIALSDFEEGTEIEEAYVTYTKLPWGLSSRIGRIKPVIGKANAVHRDQLDTVDEPIVVQRYLGAEGLARTGLEVGRFFPKFTDSLTQDLTLGIVEGGIGEEGSLFGDVRRHPTGYAHLRNFFEISPTTSVEFGNTFLIGSSGEENRSDVNAYGFDLTLQHQFDAIKRLKWQNELYIQNRDDNVLNDNATGYYSLIDYRLSQRFGLGGRYDNVERVAFNGKDEAYSAYVTLYQSEFARLRAQYQKIDFAEGGEDDRVFLQATFAIGVHKHAIR